MKIKVKKIFPQAELPEYKSKNAAGADLKSSEHVDLEPGQRHAVRTGLAIEIPPGYQGEVRPRSGLCLKHGLMVMNAPGTIDADYRGEVKVILYNASSTKFSIKPGDRIAQLIISPAVQAEFTYSENLSDTTRGAGGFGHTGLS
ncbi:MAG: dUTP diphosphatase [bacterium]